MRNLLSIGFALLGVVMHAAGVILQKKGAEKLNFKEMLNLKNLLKIKINFYLLIWVLGLILAYVISVIPTGIASINLQPQVVSAISGFGIIIIIPLSHFFLKEKLFISDLFYSLAITMLIVIICLFQQDSYDVSINYSLLMTVGAAPILALIPLLNKRLSNKTKAILISTFSGLTSGLTLIFINVAAKQSHGSLNTLFGSVYIYLFIIVGFISGLSLQATYKLGDMADIMPIQISLGIIYPLICSYFMFRQNISLLQAISIILTGICCFKLAQKH